MEKHYMQYLSKVSWRIGVLLLLFLLFVSTVNAGGWMRSEGEHRYSSRIQYSTSDRSWDRNRISRVSSCVSKRSSISHKYEYGHTYYHTYFSKLSMSTATCGNDRVSGIGDLTLGVRGRLDLYTNGNSWEASVIIPTGYDRNRRNRLGYGVLGLDLSLHFRKKLTTQSILSYSVGLLGWAGPPSSQFYTRISWKYKQNKLWSYTSSLSGTFSFNDGEARDTNSLNRDFENNYEVLSGQVSIKYNLTKRINVFGGIYKNLWGRNVSQRSGVYLSLGYIWGRR